MTGLDATGALDTSVEVDYGQWYLFDADAPSAVVDLLDDPVAQALLWEQKCAASGGAAIVYTLKQYGSTGVVVRSWPSPPRLDEGADHVAECSVALSGKRLAVSGWESSVVAGVISVPNGPLRVRVGWFGLPLEHEAHDGELEHFELDVFPGPPGPVEVLHCWPAWAPPPPESTTADGLRVYRGARAAAAREAMEWIPLLFWSPYPETTDGTVSSLWRDPVDGSRWADGSGVGSHRVLRELTAEEAAAIEAQGFPSVYTYAVDGDGRVWTSGMMPLERVPCLNLVPPGQFEMMKGLTGGLVGVSVVDLPDGWRRIFRLPRDGQGTRVQVPFVDETIEGFYQRWRDDEHPAP
jgi:hypothetical protein